MGGREERREGEGWVGEKRMGGVEGRAGTVLNATLAPHHQSDCMEMGNVSTILMLR